MSNEEILTDEYVADLLSREASDCSIKYSAMGVDAFLGKGSHSKKPTNIPKPNTRFLRNIIKGTDSHNKALLAREAAESKARLKKLEYAEEIKRKKINPTTRDIRERHMGDIRAILGGGTRRRQGDDNDDNEDKEQDSCDRAKSKQKSKSREPKNGAGEAQCSSPSHQSDSHKHNRQHRDGARRSRQREHPSDDEYQSRRSRSYRDGRSRSPNSGHRSRRTRSRDAERRRHRHRSPQRKKSTVSTKDEDMLGHSQDESIGPALPPKIRGRGAVGSSSGIDRRFSASYDPREDIQGDDDVDA